MMDGGDSSRDQWTCSSSVSLLSSLDPFPRLDPPPPSGKKRLPRALKTTQDMMISSDPVVSSPDAADSTSFPSSPEKTPLISEKELRISEEEPQENDTLDPDLTGCNRPADDVTCGEEPEDTEEHQHQLQLSVPDLIHKDPPPLEPTANGCDVWQKPSGPDSRLASTPSSGKTPCRISLGEDVLLGNGAPCGKGMEDAEAHPDLLSFE